MKICSVSLIIREMQIRAIRYHFIATRMTVMKQRSEQKQHNKHGKPCGENPSAVLWGRQMVRPTIGSMIVTELPYDTVISPSEHVPQRSESWE